MAGGFYNVSSYSGGVLTLGAKVYRTPSNWASASGDGATCFGKLRFPNCPSLLGRAAVSFQPSTPNTLNFSVPQPTFGMAVAGAETVDLWDKNMTQIAAAVAATRVDDAHFTTVAAYPAAAYVTISGTPKWYMNDRDPKGDYALLEWNSDFRTGGNPDNVNDPGGEFGRLAGVVDCSNNQVPQPVQNAGGGPVSSHYAFFSQTPGCVPFVPCGPKVVCISPNNEQFPNGATHPFPAMLDTGAAPSSAPGEFYFDETYGSKWWAWVQATMTDLLWQPPHPPCGFVVNSPPADHEEQLNWKMDDLSCPDNYDEDVNGDGDVIIHHRYYAYEPQVEARLSVPCDYGAGQNECPPALPPGVQIGWSSPVTMSGGDIAYPPKPPVSDGQGNVGGATTAYLIHTLLCEQIGGGCRFNYSYPGC